MIFGGPRACLSICVYKSLIISNFLFYTLCSNPNLMILKLMPEFQLKLYSSEFCSCNCFMLYFPNETTILLSFLAHKFLGMQ